MHITIDCRMWGEKFGGIGRYTKEIVLYLITHKKWEFTLLYSPQAFKDLQSYQNKNIQLIPCNAQIFSLKEQWEIWKKVPRCDLFWSPYMNIPFIRTKAKKQVVTLHDVFHLANPQYYSKLKQIAIAPYYFFSTRNSNLILTVSQFSKSEIQKYFGKRIADKVSVVYNGCEIQKDNVAASNIGKKYFLFVGSIKPHKNLKNALLGFKEFNNNDYQFIIVGKKEGFITGDNEVFDLVTQLNKEKEKVLFTGNINDQELYAWYKGASVLVMPSLYEGFGLPIVEAMNFNLPIICSNIPIFKEICKDKVLYFNPHSPSDICQKMNEILQAPTPHYEEWYKWSFTADKIGEIFQELIQN